MQDVFAAFAQQASVPRPDAAVVSSKRRYSELTGLSKQIAERASSDPRKFEKVRDLLARELSELREEEEIKDPAHVKGKGRPRNKRLRSAGEPKKEKGRVKCGNCGGGGT